MPQNVPDKIWLYRIVHWRNIEYILRHGMMTHTHENADPNYIDIGHRQLISDRGVHEVNVYTGDGSVSLIRLGDYVPFYFGAHSPMLYMIKNGFSGVTPRPQEDLIYVITSLEKVKLLKCDYVFSDLHAKKRVARFYKDDAFLSEIDWDTVMTKNWRNSEDDIDRRDRKQAEFLVKSHVPVEAIEIIGVKTQSRKDYVQGLVDNLGLDIRVYMDTKNKLYY